MTFFLTGTQRRALLGLLKMFADDRSAALLIALGLSENETDEIEHD